jgi:low temperature requirement protein LtrA
VSEIVAGTRHRLVRMSGRDPAQTHRASTPLELLFDLAFVVAFGQAGDQFAHALAEGYTAAGVVAFVFAIVGTCWAWINFSWFASAYDTDDWFYRLTTMVQMSGVVVFALGIPEFFASIEHGGHVGNVVLLVGYVIMRVALIGQWLRAAHQDPARRRTAHWYVVLVGSAQLGWIVVTVLDLDAVPFFAASAVLFTLEFLGPVMAERKTSGTPWHPHHIAERYGLLAIITFGEGVFGTVAAVSMLVEERGWSTEAVAIVVAGLGITFGLWWSYFIMPSGPVLARYRSRGFGWGYGHILLYGSIAATGSGLHLAAYLSEGHAVVGIPGAVSAVAIPVLVFSISLFTLYNWLLHEFDPFHIALFVGTVLTLVAAVVLAYAGASLGLCLLVITASPAIVVVGYETVGHRHQADALARILAPR